MRLEKPQCVLKNHPVATAPGSDKKTMQLLSEKFIARQLANPSGLFGRQITVHWLTKANAPMNKLMLDQLNLQPHDRILEVGFGGGDLLEQIMATRPCDHVAGVDRSPDMVRVATGLLAQTLRVPDA